VTSMALVRPLGAIAWELRSAWALGRRISVTIAHADEDRLEGTVRAVSASDAYAVVAGRHVPLERVLAVHRPSRLGDSTAGVKDRFDGRVPRRARHDPAQMPLTALATKERSTDG
jgi:hypothetical protein